MHPTTQNSTDFIPPKYNDDCISNLPKLALNLLHAKNASADSPLIRHLKKTDPKNASKIVLLVVDGFGFNQFQKHNQNPFLTRLNGAGDVSAITSVYPSQTTNALTTMNTGLNPQEHGVFEYFIYLKEVGLVNTLRFERVVTRRKIEPVEEGFKPSLMFDGKSIHRTLKEQGIDTYTHINSQNAFIAISNLLFDGSKVVPALKTSDLVVNLRKNLENVDSGYFFVHIETLDTVSHEYGPDSSHYAAELEAVTCMLQKELVEKISPQTAKETLLLITSDHGSVQVNPDETTYLNLEQKPLTWRQTGVKRKRIFPTGSPRDIFLHIRPEKLTEAKEMLTGQIGSKAVVTETRKMIEEGLFGANAPSSQFLERVGNLMVLPRGQETVWFSNPEGRKLSFLGQHGGLSSKEILVPFAVANLSSLKT
jgi:predicted AlkP superfamily pyrophosphatase or phosphodiesterase